MLQVGAIAAGCAIVVKPSELSPSVSALLTELIPKYLDPEMYHVVNGAVPETSKVNWSLVSNCNFINQLHSCLNSSGTIVGFVILLFNALTHNGSHT